MNFINLDFKKAFFFAVMLLMPLISINTQRSPFVREWFDQPFSFIAGSTQSLFFGFSEGVRGTTSQYLNLIDIKKHNAELKEQNQDLQARLIQMQELQLENARLSALLDFRQKSKMELVAARVMSRDLLSDHSTIQINKGTHHGLKTGQAVITTEGALGYIFRPQAFTASVLLLTDRYAVVDGIVARSRARGILEGKSSNSASLKYVEKSEDVKVGDLIVTSGLDNIFPKGFPVATVDFVENKPYAVSLRVDLTPVVNPSKVEEVFVILNAAEEDLSSALTMRN